LKACNFSSPEKMSLPTIESYAHNDWLMTRMVKSSPITGLDRPREFQEVKVPRLRDNSTGWW